MKTIECLSKYLDAAKGNLNFTEGNRHNTIVSLAATLNRAGFDESLVVLELCKRYERKSFPAKEIEGIVRSIYKDNASEHGIHKRTFPPEMDKGTNGQLPSSENNIEEPDEDDLLRTPCPDPESVRKYIPEAFYTHVISPEDSREVSYLCLLTLLCVLGAMMPDVICRISRWETIRTYFYLIASGVAASGKSCIKRAIDLFRIHSSKIEGESKAECDKLAAEHKAWEECKKKNKKEEDCDCGAEPQLAKPKELFLSMHISESKLTEIMANNPFYPTLLSDYELDREMELKDFPLSPLLRQAYEGENFSSHTHKHGSMSVKAPKVSMIASGTEKQTAKFFKNKEDGLSSRCTVLTLPEPSYKPLSAPTLETYHEVAQQEELLIMAVLTFSNLLSQRHIRFTFNKEAEDAINDFFEEALRRYASYGSESLNSYIRRLRAWLLRICMILTTCYLYIRDLLTDGIHELPTEIIKIVLGWCDYLIEQHIILLDMLPETTTEGNGNELKYKQAFDSLPCVFKLSEAAKAFEEKVGISSKTVHRYLKILVEKGALTTKLRKYYKIDCADSNESRPIDKTASKNNTLSDHPAFS